MGALGWNSTAARTASGPGTPKDTVSGTFKSKARVGPAPATLPSPEIDAAPPPHPPRKKRPIPAVGVLSKARSAPAETSMLCRRRRSASTKSLSPGATPSGISAGSEKRTAASSSLRLPGSRSTGFRPPPVAGERKLQRRGGRREDDGVRTPKAEIGATHAAETKRTEARPITIGATAGRGRACGRAAIMASRSRNAASSASTSAWGVSSTRSATASARAWRRASRRSRSPALISPDAR